MRGKNKRRRNPHKIPVTREETIKAIPKILFSSVLNEGVTQDWAFLESYDERSIMQRCLMVSVCS